MTDYDGYGSNTSDQASDGEYLETSSSGDRYSSYRPRRIDPADEHVTNQEDEGNPALKPKSDPDKRQETVESIMGELNELIGLDNVKAEIRELIQYVRVQDLRRREGISGAKPALHSVFYGSPGTGKTTVARIISRLLRAIGMLSKGHLIETDRSGLVGNYIGQTANKTDGKIDEAMGGVLFIDEAYSLSRGEDARWDYGAEAIEILMKRMEDNRDDLVVIAAGYPGPMRGFLSSNEGLKSRFSSFIHFKDFSPNELLEIFEYIAAKENYNPTTEALDSVFETVESAYQHRDISFGNARYVRNLFEDAIRNQAIRLSAVSEPTMAELRCLLPEDIPLPSDAVKRHESRMGFVKDKEEE